MRFLVKAAALLCAISVSDVATACDLAQMLELRKQGFSPEQVIEACKIIGGRGGDAARPAAPAAPPLPASAAPVPPSPAPKTAGHPWDGVWISRDTSSPISDGSFRLLRITVLGDRLKVERSQKYSNDCKYFLNCGKSDLEDMLEKRIVRVFHVRPDAIKFAVRDPSAPNGTVTIYDLGAQKKDQYGGTTAGGTMTYDYGPLGLSPIRVALKRLDLDEAPTAPPPSLAPPPGLPASPPSPTRGDRARQIEVVTGSLSRLSAEIARAEENGAKCRADAERRVADNVRLSGTGGVAAVAGLSACAGYADMAAALRRQKDAQETMLSAIRARAE